MAAATEQSLLQPLVPKPTTGGDNATSDSGVLLRLLSVILVGTVSLWASHEAAKGFDIIIVNNVKNSPLGRKFHLFYQSDDRACRILLNTSSFVERFLYHGVPLHHRKLVRQVIIRFSGNHSTAVSPRMPVASGASHGEYVISLSSSLMEDRDYDLIITSTLRLAMARIWLWGDETGAPPQLMAGMAEYIAAVAVDSSQPLDRGGSPDCWKDKDPESVAKFLAYCEGLSEGFIGRLNQMMRRHRWDDRTVDMAFGKRTPESACDSYSEMVRLIKT